MSSKYAVGERVWVPSTRLEDDRGYALASREVLDQEGRSVIVDDRGGSVVKVSSRLVHADTLGFLVLRIGDLETESTLLDPLAKSVLQYLRLLVPDDVVFSLHARTTAEMEEFMKLQGAAVSHVILVGHGSGTALKLIGGGWLPAKEFARIRGIAGGAKTVVSLACATGRTSFGRVVSSSKSCKEYVGPLADAHGAGASLFLQYLFHAYLLHGHEFMTAARRADDATEGIRFRYWRNGKSRSR